MLRQWALVPALAGGLLLAACARQAAPQPTATLATTHPLTPAPSPTAAATPTRTPTPTPLPTPTPTTTPTRTPTATPAPAPTHTPTPTDTLAEGKRLYTLTCGVCHGADGKGNPATTAGPLLRRTKASLLGAIRYPPALMAPITPEELSDADFDKIYEYILTLEQPQ